MSDKQSETRQKYLGVGISLGVAIGAGLGVALGNLALGIGHWPRHRRKRTATMPNNSFKPNLLRRSLNSGVIPQGE